MLRIGLIGIENSHITHFTRFLNVENRFPGARATALVGGRSARNRELAELGGIDRVVNEPAELVGEIDAAIVSTRDGALHLEHSRPVLAAGIPTLVDKPLAASLADAEELLNIAADRRTVLLSCSALRFVPEIPHFRSSPRTGALRHLHVVGPADPASEYSGLFFYGIHPVEVALEILGNPPVDPDSLDVETVQHDGTIVASLTIQDVRVTLTFVAPTEDTKVPFHVTAVYDATVLAHDLTLGEDYNAPALEEFLGAVRSGRTVRTQEQLLSPVAVLEAITTSLDGRP